MTTHRSNLHQRILGFNPYVLVEVKPATDGSNIVHVDAQGWPDPLQLSRALIQARRQIMRAYRKEYRRQLGVARSMKKAAAAANQTVAEYKREIEQRHDEFAKGVHYVPEDPTLSAAQSAIADELLREMDRRYFEKGQS